MTYCRTENALFSSEYVIQIRESTSCVHVLSLVLIPSSTNRRVYHFHPKFLLQAAKNNNNAAKVFVSLKQTNPEGFIAAPLILF